MDPAARAFDDRWAAVGRRTENTDNVAENAEDTVNATENIAKRVEPYGYAVIYVGQVINGTEGSCLCAYFLDLAELSITMDLDPALQAPGRSARRSALI